MSMGAAAEAERRKLELEQEEARRRAAARRARPGFGQLMKAFGVEEESPSSEGGDSDEEEVEAVEDAALPVGAQKLAAAGEGEEEEEAVDFEDDAVEEEENEDEAVCHGSPGEPGDSAAAAKELETGGLDFFDRFFEDPARALRPSSKDRRPSGTVQFSWPGLGRCEAHGCDIQARFLSCSRSFSTLGHTKRLMRDTRPLGAPPAPSGPETLLSQSWKLFRLAPGLREAFASLVEAEPSDESKRIALGPGC
eukprot:s4839_g1.t1